MPRSGYTITVPFYRADPNSGSLVSVDKIGSKAAIILQSRRVITNWGESFLIVDLMRCEDSAIYVEVPLRLGECVLVSKV